MKIIQGALTLLVLGCAAAANGDAPSHLRVPSHKVMSSELSSTAFLGLQDEWGGGSSEDVVAKGKPGSSCDKFTGDDDDVSICYSFS